ncbi:MAG TPA: glutamate--tRNA ligase family protein [Candidatus Paceibacterota bacterium]
MIADTEIKSPRVRFPPSPTGYCHVGTARMALLNYLFAKKNHGAIIMRIEDTDRERSTKEYEEDIIESLHWLGLSWDEFFRQSERTEAHALAISKLLDANMAYISREPSKKEPRKSVEVVRLRNPGTTITFHDFVRGDITVDTSDLGDFVIARSVRDPLYHLAVVVDDADMRISHIIRGEDHISNTPRQILIQEALGYARPVYAHYPLSVATDRSKLSKRRGDVAVRDFRAKGFLPAAILNYLAILGWTPPSQSEFLSFDQMITEFDLSGIHKSAAAFDTEKLRWYNRHYLHEMKADDFASGALQVLEKAIGERSLSWNGAVGKALVPLIHERIYVWDDLRELVSSGELDLFFADPSLQPTLIPDKKSTPAEAVRHLQHTFAVCKAVDAVKWTEEGIKSALWEYATAEGRGAVLWPLRYALSGRDKSPDPFAISAIIGKEATLRRVTSAITALKSV